jgi:hypothetical protein
MAEMPGTGDEFKVILALEVLRLLTHEFGREVIAGALAYNQRVD